MTARDRLMLMGIVAAAALLGVWFMVISPERERATKVTAEVQAARQQLESAESKVASAHSAQVNYSRAYASLVSLGQAVPASAETPALIFTLDRATHSRNVQFTSITNSSAASTGSTATAAAQSAGFSQQSFTFVFSGSFADLNKLFNQLESFTVLASSGPLRVSGRLLTINGVSLAPKAAEGSASGSNTNQLTGTITATAYVLPAGQSTLGGATAAGPAGVQPTTSTTPASGATTPAVVRLHP